MATTITELKANITNKQIDKLVSFFGNHEKSGYKPYKLTSGITSWCLLAAHARPATHAQAQANAKAIMLRLNIDVAKAFNTSSAWHGSPRSEAIIYKANGPLARYSAAARTPIGNFTLRCATHATTRINCKVTCEQGLYNAGANKWLAELAYGASVGKATTKANGKRKATKATTPPKATTNAAPPNVEGDSDNERSAETQGVIDALTNE